MSWTTELPFNLDGVEGDLKITYNPMNQKFYQDNIEIKKRGLGFGGLKYKVKTTDGGSDVLKVKAALLPGRQVVFRGMTINLEKKLGGLSLLLAFMPFVFIIFAVFVSTGGGILIGGAIPAVCGAIGMLAIGNALRNTKDFGQQIIYTIIISVAATALYFVLALVVGLIFGTIFGAAYLFS